MLISLSSLPVDGVYDRYNDILRPTVRSRCSLFGIHTCITPSMDSVEIHDRYFIDPRLPQWTLTLLSVWWAFGQLVASLISWVFIANYSCNPSIPFGECPRSQNMGWRYTL